MAKTLFAFSTATLMVAFVAGWAVSDSQAALLRRLRSRSTRSK